MTIHYKLVRDKIPQIIIEAGKIPITKKLNQIEYIKEIRNKCEEELKEYISAKTNQEALEELADLLEIIHSLAEIHGSSIEEVEKIRVKKAETRGGFKDRVFLIEVRDD